MGSSNTTKGAGSQGASQEAIRQGKELYTQSTPVRQELLGQTLEALMTGGVGAKIPLIQRAVEQQKAGLAQGLRSTSENIA